ncbi:MAG: outer membrane beta-barrel protein [Ignavibacteriaceae bacterium]|nr:outer membrane beta-barrel protein [Ignavibacteriaceae bacterium]
MKKNFLIVICFLALTFTTFAQPVYGTELTGNFVIPIGKNADYSNVGFGGLVGFYYDVAENFRMALVLGYMRVSVNESKVNELYASGGQQANITGGVGVIPALISIRLISPGPGMRLYGLLEGGLYSYKTSFSGTYGGGAPVDESEFRSEPGIAFGGGVLFPLNKELSLDVNVRYHWVNDSEYIDYEGTSVANSRLLTLGVGVNWFFALPQQ